MHRATVHNIDPLLVVSQTATNIFTLIVLKADNSSSLQHKLPSLNTGTVLMINQSAIIRIFIIKSAVHK